MNAMLHDIEGQILLGDTLSNFGKQIDVYKRQIAIIPQITTVEIK